MAEGAVLPVRPMPIRGRSLWSDARRRLRRNRAAVAAGIVPSRIKSTALRGAGSDQTGTHHANGSS